MPVLAQPVTEITQHIFFPIIRQIANRLLVSLNLDQCIGDKIYINTDWSTHSKTSDINNNPMLGNNQLLINATPQLNPTSQKWDMYTFHHTTAYGVDVRTFYNQVPIFCDNVHNTRIVEMRSPVTLNLNCDLRVMSAEIAYQTPQQIFNDYETGAVYKFNDLAYDYPVPHAIISVLYQMWQMDRINGKPKGRDFMTYLKKGSNGGWQVHKHRDKEEYEVVVPVYDLQTLVTLEYSDDKPEAIMENRLPIGFSIQFNIYTQFAMPTLTLFKYHPWFDNQLLPFECIPVNRTERFNNIKEYHCGSQDELYDKMTGFPTGTLRVPWYDDWVIPNTYFSRTFAKYPVCILGVLLDEENTYTEIDLKEEFSTDVKLSDIMKEILYQQGERSMENDAFYTVALFRDNKQLIPERDFTFDENLILKFKPAYMEGHYRVVVFAPTQVLRIHGDWYYMMRQLYPYLPKIIKLQIKCGIEDGSWKNPDWSNISITVADDGWIYERDTGKALIHISQYEYFRRNYANNTFARIFKNSIITRKTSKLKAGNTR